MNKPADPTDDLVSWAADGGWMPAPTTDQRDNGFATGEAITDTNANWLVRAATEWLVWLSVTFDTLGLSERERIRFFGDGADGDATVTTAVTLSRDTYYYDLTLGSGGSIDVAGNKLFVYNVLTFSSSSGAGAIHSNGAAGSNVTGHVQAGGAGGVTVTHKAVGGRIAGGAGGAGGSNPAGAGSAGSSVSLSTGGCAGGAGGAGHAGAPVGGGGSGGSAGSSSSSAEAFTPNVLDLIGGLVATVSAGLGGGGGGGGGGQVASFGDGGAGGGAGGGTVFVAAYSLVVGASTPEGVISANGGQGGTTDTVGYQGAGGGGGGGGGGCVVLLVGQKSGAGAGAIANGLKADGGAGNTGFTGSTLPAGSGGSGGRIVYHELFTPTTTTATGSAGSGQTGGTCRVTL